MWGIIPAAGQDSRAQPLGFPKEMLPLGTRRDGGVERPRVVSEYLVDRMLRAGATRLCFVVPPGRTDIMDHYGGSVGFTHVCYTIQPASAGICDAVFCALPLVHPDDDVLIGMPDTIWYPEDALCQMPRGMLSFLLFPVDQPEMREAVVTDDLGYVREIQVRQPEGATGWAWGALKIPGRVFRELHTLWLRRNQADRRIGTLVNEFLRRGGKARGVRAGRTFVDVGTPDGYRDAERLVAGTRRAEKVVDIAAFIETERAGAWALGRAVPLAESSAETVRPDRET